MSLHFKCIELHVPADATLLPWLQQTKEVAAHYDCPVRFTFNDDNIQVSKTSDLGRIAREFWLRRAEEQKQLEARKAIYE